MERGEREQQCLDGSMQFSKDHPTLSSVYAAKIGEVERVKLSALGRDSFTLWLSDLPGFEGAGKGCPGLL